MRRRATSVDECELGQGQESEVQPGRQQIVDRGWGTASAEYDERVWTPCLVTPAATGGRLMPKTSSRVQKAKTPRKLTLGKETLANLAPREPKAVKGGGLGTSARVGGAPEQSKAGC